MIQDVKKIISGGQTGADIGALVGAKKSGLKTGGIAPKGWKTEKGPQPVLRDYGLIESHKTGYRDRTLDNVLNSDATIIFSTNPSSAGTKLTIKFCKAQNKPHLLIDPYGKDVINLLKDFISTYKPSVLNCAGNRESKSPGISKKTASLIEAVFKG